MVACAEGDFHSLAARMFGELLRGHGLGATLLAADQTIFGDFLRWLQTLLVLRGVPPQALVAGLEALRPVIGAVDTGAALLLDLGRQELPNGPHAA